MSNVILGKELKEFRIMHGKTQFEMAREVGVSEKVFQWWETGRHVPSDLNAYKLKQVLKKMNEGQEVEVGSILPEAEACSAW